MYRFSFSAAEWEHAEAQINMLNNPGLLDDMAPSTTAFSFKVGTMDSVLLLVETFLLAEISVHISVCFPGDEDTDSQASSSPEF